ncbi:MAG: DUF2092 domain-containing protein [Desulfoferrobacter sp.]
MKKAISGGALLLAFMLVLVAAPVSAQQASPTDQDKSAEKAMAALQRMADFLSQAKHFSVTADMGFDVVQEFGQKIEFGETRNIVLNRPDHLRVDTTKRDGSKSQLIFDGKDLSLLFMKDNVYATVSKPGTVDEAVAYFLNDLGMRFPLAEMLSSKLDQVLPKQVVVAAYVEQSQIAGVPCDHLALRGDQEDLQVWVAQGDKPLPQRVVITYRRQDGRPQFWAQFSDWNLAPKVPDSLFVFKPPKGATKIAFSPRQVMGAEPGQTKEGK